jgi:hypothetical protein
MARIGQANRTTSTGGSFIPNVPHIPDQFIVRRVAWLLANQRSSGRWWTRSLNRDGWQFITYSGTVYPLLALAMCHALPSSTQMDGSPKSARGLQGIGTHSAP